MNTLKIKNKNLSPEAIEELEALYSNLLEEGYADSEALSLCCDIEERYAALQEVKDSITLRKQLPLCEIEKLQIVAQNGGYKNLEKPLRDYLLWKLGFDTKRYAYTTDIGYYVFNDHKSFGEFVLGQERTDEAWTHTVVDDLHVCSYEAILKQKGHFHLMGEITKLLRGVDV